MKDIELAKKIMMEEKQSLVIVKNGIVIVKSDMFGIKPLYLAVKDNKNLLQGASSADRSNHNFVQHLSNNTKTQKICLKTNFKFPKLLTIIDVDE